MAIIGKITMCLGFSLLIMQAGNMSARAGGAADFLQNLSGKFRGEGSAQLINAEQPQKVRCRLNNDFDTEKTELSVSGKCAATSGASLIRGKLLVENGKVKGTLFSPFPKAKLTDSEARFSNNVLVVNASFVNEETGELLKTSQQITSLPDGGFKTEFSRYDNSSGNFKRIGSMAFSKSGE